MGSCKRSAFRLSRFLILPAALLLWSVAGFAQASQVINYRLPDRLSATLVAEPALSYSTHAVRTDTGDEGRYLAILRRLRAHAGENGLPAHAVSFLDTERLLAVPAAEQEAELIRMLGQYAQLLWRGLLSPTAVVSEWGYAAQPESSVDPIRILSRDGISEAALAALSPNLPAYQRLLAALETYRAIEARGGWPPLSPATPGTEGDSAALRERLAAEGYVVASGEVGLRDAIVAFQARHGLATDGVVGPKTLAALNVTVAQRVAQITYNLERLRWLPRDLPEPRLEVNVPAYTLTLVGSDVPWSARVIVGSTRHRTPLFPGHVEAVVVYPPWTVPASITRNEILPRLRRDPGFLRRNDMVILNRPDDPYGEQTDWSRARGAGGILLQQQPGENNALGLFKFDMPNLFGVYLHDTPAKAAFNRAERALSHGCMRVEDPDRLASLLLRDRLAREPDLIERALEGRTTRRLPLSKAIPLLVLYQTAVVDAAGNIHFFDDVYGYDRRMAMLMAPGRGAPYIRTAMAVPCHAVAG